MPTPISQPGPSASDTSPASETLAYYEREAGSFVQSTAAVDLGPIHARFLRCIPPCGRILDLGCGSGRDALRFSRLGYQVEAVDGLRRSPASHRPCRP